MPEIKNWIGLPPHPTDEYVHWKDRNQVKRAQELRELWDDVTSTGSEESLKRLLKVAFDAGVLSECESQAGASL